MNGHARACTDRGGHAHSELPIHSCVMMQSHYYTAPLRRGIRPEFSGQQRLGNDRGLCAHEKDNAEERAADQLQVPAGQGQGFPGVQGSFR